MLFRSAVLRARLRQSPLEKSLAIVTVEEGLRGWLADINRQLDLDRQIIPYRKLQRYVELAANWTILGWDAECAVDNHVPVVQGDGSGLGVDLQLLTCTSGTAASKQFTLNDTAGATVTPAGPADHASV